jgi:hypothetical protein
MFDCFVHETVGQLVYDKNVTVNAVGKHVWWARVFVDKNILYYYAWHLKKYGISIQLGVKPGPHVTFVRGEDPPNKQIWGKDQEIVLYYSHIVRGDNDYHVWVDAKSPQLDQLRSDLGLPPKPQKYLSDGRILASSYHITIGRTR